MKIREFSLFFDTTSEDLVGFLEKSSEDSRGLLHREVLDIFLDSLHLGGGVRGRDAGGAGGLRATSAMLLGVRLGGGAAGGRGSGTVACRCGGFGGGLGFSGAFGGDSLNNGYVEGSFISFLEPVGAQADPNRWLAIL